MTAYLRTVDPVDTAELYAALLLTGPIFLFILCVLVFAALTFFKG